MKKMVLVLAMLVTVVGLAFAQNWCKDATEVISKGGLGTQTAWFRNASQSQSVEVFYTIKRKKGQGEYEDKGSMIISPLDTTKVPVDGTIKGIKVTSARVCE